MVVLGIKSQYAQNPDAVEKNSLVLQLNITDLEDTVKKVCQQRSHRKLSRYNVNGLP